MSSTDAFHVMNTQTRVYRYLNHRTGAADLISQRAAYHITSLPVPSVLRLQDLRSWLASQSLLPLVQNPPPRCCHLWENNTDQNSFNCYTKQVLRRDLISHGTHGKIYELWHCSLTGNVIMETAGPFAPSTKLQASYPRKL